MKSLHQLFMRLWRHFMYDSLYRNSIYLLLNMGFTALAGFLFWALCARLYSVENVGYATALLGAMALGTAFSSLGMNRTVLRFFALSKTQSQDLVTKVLLVTLGSLVAGLVLSFFLTNFGLQQAHGWTAVVFIATVLAMSIKVLFDNVFIAFKSASGTLIENIVMNVCKLGFPVFAVGWGFMGIFSAQLVGALAAILASVLLLRMKHRLAFRTRPSLAAMRGKWQFAFGSYTTDLVGVLPASILPIVVVSKLGAVSGALWYTAMLVINFLLTVTSSINQAMFAEMSSSTGGIFRFIKKASLAMIGLVAPLAALICIFAPQILSLFSPEYVAAAPTLRLMAIFALIGIANYVTGSILAYYKKVFYLTVVNTVNAAVVIGYCLLYATDLQGIAIGWMLGEVANIVLFVGGASYTIRHILQERKI